MSNEWNEARRVRSQMRERAREHGSDEAPTLIEIEKRLATADEDLESLVEDYDQASRLSALARDAWEKHLALTTVAIADSGDKEAKDIREARAKLAMSVEGVPGEDLYRAHLITKAAEESAAKRLTAVQSRLSGLQSLYRGLLAASGLT